MAIYLKNFEQLFGRLYGVSNEVLTNNFIKGLRLDISATLRIYGLRGIAESMPLAQMIEEFEAAAK